MDKQERGWTSWGVFASLIVPMVGIVLGIRLLIRERVGPGLALLATGLICWVIWIGIGVGVAEHRASTQATERAQQIERAVEDQRDLEHPQPEARPECPVGEEPTPGSTADDTRCVKAKPE